MGVIEINFVLDRLVTWKLLCRQWHNIRWCSKGYSKNEWHVWNQRVFSGKNTASKFWVHKHIILLRFYNVCVDDFRQYLSKYGLQMTSTFLYKSCANGTWQFKNWSVLSFSQFYKSSHTRTQCSFHSRLYNC